MKLLLPAISICLALASPCSAKNPLEDSKRPTAKTEALSPAETASGMKVPDGFRVELIVAEPDIVQPIAYTIDERGRLWVVECTNYPNAPGEAKDRIVVLSDEDGDGSFEKKQVFWDKANFSSGIAVGFGGVWLGSPPNLLFLPDQDGDAVMDGKPEVILDGWGTNDTHETLNNFIWGPDGWLYGTQGIFTHSKVGRPGTPEKDRVRINAGVWRFHPTRKVFERWCEGVSNQWGLDWNDRGEAFFAACVVPHMWHAIEGAHYTRQAGGHFNPELYENIKTIAWGRYEKAAYCGGMVYLGGAFPDKWRDKFFFHDIHMNKLRCEEFIADGSGFRSKKVADFMVSPDPWFRGLSAQYGPDGGVFISDWYDAVPCHQQRAFTDRSNGRIYKIVNDQVKARKVDLSKASDSELVAMQLEKNDWFVRQARRLLQQRGPKPETTAALENILFNNPDETRQLRALWTLHSQGALSESTALRSLKANSSVVRGWSVTCVTESGKPSAAIMTRLLEMATHDPSKSVRLRLASAAQKIPASERWPLIKALGSHAEDIDDRNLPLMIWYGTEAATAGSPKTAADHVAITPQPRLQRYIPRRLLRASLNEPDRYAPALASLSTTLESSDSKRRKQILTGLLEGAKGSNRIPEPESWESTYPALSKDKDPQVRQQALTLALLYGNSSAMSQLRDELADESHDPKARLRALKALAAQRDPASLKLFLKLACVAGPLREPAIRSLSNYNNPSIPSSLFRHYSNCTASEKAATLEVLVSRLSWCQMLFKAIDDEKIPCSDLNAPVARLAQGHRDKAINDWLTKNWGTLKPTNKERRKEIKRYRKFLGEDAILRADVKNGEAIYKRTCSACHHMFGEGGNIGPHLPGNFTDVEYLLQNLLDPNAFIGRDYQQSFITLSDGSLVAGAVTDEDERSLSVKTLAGTTTTIPKNNIKKRELSPQSIMPEGLLSPLQEREVRDLFLYLRQSKRP